MREWDCSVIAVLCFTIFLNEGSPRAGFDPPCDSMVAIAAIGTNIIIYLVRQAPNKHKIKAVPGYLEF